MNEFITSKEMRIYDLNAIALGVSDLQLMEAAGRGVADTIERVIGDLRNKHVVVFAGTGGNAGDGLTAARHLASKGAKVTVYMLSKPEEIRHEASIKQYLAIELMDLSIDLKIVKDLNNIPDMVNADVIIDALLGLGVKGKVRSLYSKAIDCINRSKALKIAVDVPSGVDPDTGEILGNAVKADITVTFHKPKVGLKKRSEYVGKLVIVDIGIPPEAEYYVGPGDLIYNYKARGFTSHKGQAGKVLVIGGSETFTGAPTLSALAALRTGSDLAYVAAPSRAADVIATYSPNIITIKLEGSDHLIPQHLNILKHWIDRADCIIIGPGLGLNPESEEAFIEITKYTRELNKPLVIDADGIKHLARNKDVIYDKIILTPHSGEFKKLTGMDLPDERDLWRRAEVVKKACKELGNPTILLKGPIDVISDGSRVKFNKTGAPAMAVGGTGDVLSGIAASLLAKGLEPFVAGYLAAFINGLAGAVAYKEIGEGITPTDILDRIPKVIADPLNVFKEYLVYRRVK
ncbi:MAG: bifunctional ADP-dependent NAD(P)H-hydrate dehydratase/NAD(P)H-hydrate epimerase [Desulfurococcales archaeon ex4484_42]|nr:MAG: bifunctional ADP-dependent NAD(P)H-hydrate dehydratase/NAD(P)H-hydrate epimerase [Desulfurococcales archaeon ex4484_42]